MNYHQQQWHSGVQWAFDAQAVPLQHMRVDLGRLDLLVPQQFLHRSDVVSIFQAMLRSTWLQATAASRCTCGRTMVAERRIRCRCSGVIGGCA